VRVQQKIAVLTAGAGKMSKLVVIGASAGGVEALKKLLSRLPSDFGATALIVMHIGARDSNLPEVLSRVCALPVRHARDGELLVPSLILLAPPDQHLTVIAGSNGGAGSVRLSRGPKENFTRPAIDPLFRSAAAEYGTETIGVILSGYLDDGTVGMQAVKACGGVCIVQDPAEAFAPDMPTSALENVDIDMVLPLHEIASVLARIAGEETPDREDRMPIPLPNWIRIENRFLHGDANVDELSEIGSPSILTCPECGGSLFEAKGSSPRRFRCHTGHAFTAQTLSQLQETVVEEALWVAVRALDEKGVLARQLAEDAAGRGQDLAAQQHADRAAQTLEAAQVLRKVLAK
jgi:two-component system chemotaxis response regulator CheB